MGGKNALSSVKPRLVSFYSGCGGLDFGFKEAGFEPVWANDIDPVSVKTYENLVGPHIWLGDIDDLQAPGKGSAEIVVGGPPCQGFSHAGKMDPNDPRSKHVWKFLEHVERIQPKAFVMENVKALAENQRWAAVREGLIKRAEMMGYETKLHLLNAADFGVPQARERMFLIGVRAGGPVEIEPTTLGDPVTVRQTLKTLPPYGKPGNDNFCVAKITAAKQPVLRKSPYAGMLFNGAGRPLNLDAPALTLPATMGGNRTPIIDQEALENNVENWVVGYHKHLWDGGTPLTKIPSRLRRLTVEEAAALQTFPHWMEWVGPTSARFRQIGNAVPPELSYNVAVAVLKAMSL